MSGANIQVSSSQHVSVNQAENIVQHFHAASTTSEAGEIPRELNHIPYIDLENQVFGRGDDLEKLHAALAQNRHVAVVRSVAGMGKTTLARAYVTRFGGEYAHVCWLGSADKLVFSVVGDVLLHRRLGLEFTAEKPGEIFVKIMDALGRLPATPATRPALLVLDNTAENLLSEQIFGRPLADFLPGTGWAKIATARDRLPGFRDFPLEKLDFEAAAKLFRQHFDQPDDERLRLLFEKIDYHTLTVELIAKTLQNAQGLLPFDTLFEKISRHQWDDPALEERIRVDHPGSDVSMFKHLLDTFSVAGLDDAAACALRVFILLPFEVGGKGHELPFFGPALGLDEGTLRDVARTLAALADRGWLERDPKNRYRLNRLLREVLPYQLPMQLAEHEVFVMFVYQMFRFDISTNFTLLFPKIPYGEAVLDIFGNSNDAAVSLLKNNLGIVYLNLGERARARDLLEAALASDLKNFGPAHPSVAVSQSNLATVYGDLGEYALARDLLEAALASDLKNFGPAHPSVALRKSNLATVYGDLGEYAQARDLLEAALASDLKNFGTKHPSVAAHQSNLAIIYRALGEYGRSRDLLEAVLSSNLKNFGPEHPSVAVSQSNLANVYGDLGEHARARNLLETALASDLKNFGPEHPLVAANQNNLAHVCVAEENWIAALALWRQAQANYLKNFGENHPNTRLFGRFVERAEREIAGQSG